MENPITQLLSRTVKQSGLARVQIVEALGYSNLSKGCRRLDRHLAGEIRDADFMARLAQVLAVPTVQLEVALEATVAQEMKAEDLAREADRRSTFARRGPHLWTILPSGYHPSLITVLGPEFFLLVTIPSEVVELPDYEGLLEVGAIARAHFGDPNRRVRQAAGYIYRRSLDETFGFTTEGECLGRRDGPPPTSVVRSGFRGGILRVRRTMGIPDL